MTVSRLIPAILLMGGSYLAPPDDGATFSDCMRDHGVADFPEVTVGDDGSIQLGAPVDVFSSAHSDALAACADTLPEGTTFPVAPEAPELQALPELPELPGCD